eukprot:491453_1
MTEQESTPNKGEESGAPLLDTTSDPNVLTPMRIKVKVYTIVQMLVSLIFWIWALVNILRDLGFDAGVISFVFPFFAGICGYVSTSKGYQKMLFVNIHLLLTVFGHFLVTLNYLAGVFVSGVSQDFKIYCAVFTGLWFVSWILCSFWAWKWRKMSKQYAEKFAV